MRRVPYCCADSKKQYEAFYKAQSGGGSMPVFVGTPYQKGYGLGGLFSSLFKSALPLIKSGGKNIAKTLLSTGVGLASDAIQGKNMREASKARFRNAGMGLLKKASNVISQPTPSTKRIKRKQPRQNARRGKRSKRARHNDIFE